MKNKPVPEQKNKSQKKPLLTMKKSGGIKSPLTWLFWIFLVLGIFAFLKSSLSQPDTFTLMPAENVSQGRKGQGVFIFYEYAPTPYQGVDFSKTGINTEIRYREGTPLAPLSPSIKNRIQTWLEAEKKAAVEEGKKEISEIEIIRPLPDFYTPSFRVRPSPYPHNIPQLGDNKRVKDLSSEGREWEKAYFEEVIKTNQILSAPYGRVRLGCDGFENILTPASLMGMEPGDLADPLTSEKTLFHGLKFVEDRLYYLAVDCPATVRPRSFTPGQATDLRLEGGMVLTGRLDLVRKDKDGRELYIFSMREGYDEIKDMRFTRLEILGPGENVYSIPVDCLAKDSGGVYCYLLDQSRKAVRINVEIAGSRDKAILIRTEETTPSKKIVLQPYDQLLRNPEKITEGKTY